MKTLESIEKLSIKNIPFHNGGFWKDYIVLEDGTRLRCSGYSSTIFCTDLKKLILDDIKTIGLEEALARKIIIFGE